LIFRRYILKPTLPAAVQLNLPPKSRLELRLPPIFGGIGGGCSSLVSHCSGVWMLVSDECGRNSKSS